jgi:hypothetical protein
MTNVLSQMEHLKCLLHTYLPPTILQPTHPPTYLSTHSPIYLHTTYLPTYILITYLLIHLDVLFTYLPTHPPNYHVLEHTYLIDYHFTTNLSLCTSNLPT